MMLGASVTDAEGDLGAPEAVPALDLAGAGQREPGVAAEQSVKQPPVRAGLRLHHAVLWEYYLVRCTVSHIVIPHLFAGAGTVCHSGRRTLAHQH